MSAGLPAADDLVAGGPRPLDEPLDAGHVVGMDQRRDRRRLVARVAQHVLVREPVKQLQEAVGDGLLDEQARAREAHLAGVVVLAGGLAGGRLEVTVVEHDQRALAAQLAGERHDVARPRTGRSARPSLASR